MRGASSGTGESGEGEGAKDWGLACKSGRNRTRKIRPSNGPQCVANFQAINGSGRGRNAPECGSGGRFSAGCRFCQVKSAIKHNGHWAHYVFWLVWRNNSHGERSIQSVNLCSPMVSVTRSHNLGKLPLAGVMLSAMWRYYPVQSGVGVCADLARSGDTGPPARRHAPAVPAPSGHAAHRLAASLW